ncbi:MAG TPA: class IV adenylate cyclase [Anaerolineales bacterium]
MKNQELEVKFYVADLLEIEARLRALSAHLEQSRVHEVNLRFDTPDGDLGRGYRVLRLRQDDAARLTYKGPSQYQEGVRARQEIEFTVSDFEAARAFLEALGYVVSMMYEKYRTTYELDGVHITLDEMPYGDFIEIEGPDPKSIRSIQDRLELDWEKRVPESYTALFEQLRLALRLPFKDLSFANFDGLDISMSVIRIQPADLNEQR